MDGLIICKSPAMKAVVEKFSICILAEDRPQSSSVNLEVVFAKSVREAKNFFRSLPIACLVAPLSFKGASPKPFLDWFRKHFPKVLIIIRGKKFAEDNIRWQEDSNVVFLPSSHLDFAIQTAAHLLQERRFGLDLKNLWAVQNDHSSPWPQKVLKYLFENNRFLHIASVQEIADHFGITASHLVRNFNSDFPLTLKQFLLITKICYAAWLKDTTTSRLEEIASRCFGFADSSHLGHATLKCLGVPLSSFGTSHTWQETLLWGFENFQNLKAKNESKIRQ